MCVCVCVCVCVGGGGGGGFYWLILNELFQITVVISHTFLWRHFIDLSIYIMSIKDFHIARDYVWTASQVPRPLGRGIWRTVPTSPNALWQQTSLYQDYNMPFMFSPYICEHSPLMKIRIWCSKRELFLVLLPLLRHVTQEITGHWTNVT